MGPITDAHKLTYQRNVELAIQQKRTEFENAFTYTSGLSGRQANMLELIGSTTAIVNGARGGDTPNIDNTIEPVWIKPNQIEWGKVIEKEDAIKALTDYQSPFTQAGAAAVVRAKDQILADSIFGPRIIGQDGLVVAPYDNTGKTVAVDVGVTPVAATGMNVKKLIRGVRLFQALKIDIDSEQFFFFANAQEMEELYNDITYINKDYRDKAVLEGKQVRQILNTTILPTERMPNVDAATHKAAMVCKSGLNWGEFDPIMTKAEPNPAKKYRIHPYMETWIGATRNEDVKVLEVLNKR